MKTVGSTEMENNSVDAAASPLTYPAETLLGLVRAEATKFGRCCDLYQDGLGTFADHECQQRTFAMLRSVQQVLGVDKCGGPLTAEEVSVARSRAVLNNAAPDLLATLRAIANGNVITTSDFEAALAEVRSMAREAVVKAGG